MPNINNQLIYDLNQAIIADDLLAAAKLLVDIDDKTINEYDVKDLLTKRRPIDCAVEVGSPEMLQLICLKKPKLDEHCESSGRCPIHAVMTREYDGSNLEEFESIFQTLYLAGADFRTKEKVTEFSLLHLAVVHNKPNFIPDLVKHCRCDVNAIDSQQRTLLWHVKDKYGVNHGFVDMILELGGRECSNATMELHDRFNQQYEKYLKYAVRYPIRFNREPVGNVKVETDEDFINLGKSQASPLVANSLLAAPATEKEKVSAAQPVINMHVTGILKGIPEPMYKQFLVKLEKREDKDIIIDAVIKECEVNQVRF